MPEARTARRRRMSQPAALPNPREISQDILIAQALASHGRVSGELVAALRRRLCDYIHALAEPARTTLISTPDMAETTRNAHLTAIGQALQRAQPDPAPGTDPAQSLRLLAKSAEALAAMTARRRQTQGSAS
ncbi:hypothetical protein ACWGNE_09295 [Streptomyces xiamenensis]